MRRTILLFTFVILAALAVTHLSQSTTKEEKIAETIHQPEQKPPAAVQQAAPKKLEPIKLAAPEVLPEPTPAVAAHWQDPEWNADPVLIEKRDAEEKETHELQHAAVLKPLNEEND